MPHRLCHVAFYELVNPQVHASVQRLATKRVTRYRVCIYTRAGARVSCVRGGSLSTQAPPTQTSLAGFAVFRKLSRIRWDYSAGSLNTAPSGAGTLLLRWATDLMRHRWSSLFSLKSLFKCLGKTENYSNSFAHAPWNPFESISTHLLALELAKTVQINATWTTRDERRTNVDTEQRDAAIARAQIKTIKVIIIDSW